MIDLDNFDMKNFNKCAVSEPSPKIYSEYDDMCMASSENLIKNCQKCGCDNFYEKDIDNIDWYVMEKKVICKNCKNVVNYWGYGFYENTMNKSEYMRYIRNKKMKRILK